MPDLLRRFRAEAPRVQFDLFQGAAHEILERLAGGRSDLAITSPRPPGYPWRVLDVERLCLAVPRDHRFATRTRFRLADAGDEPFVGLGPGFGLRQLTDELCEQAGIAPPVVFEAMELPDRGGPGRRPDSGSPWSRRPDPITPIPVSPTSRSPSPRPSGRSV